MTSAADSQQPFSLHEATALLELGVRNHGWYLTERDHAGILDVIDTLSRTIRAVNDNATSWHADEDGKARALNVIAVWTAEALAGRIHPSVEALT